MRAIARSFGVSRQLLSRYSTSSSTPQRSQLPRASHRRFQHTMTASPFTQAVVKSMRNLYPENLADKSFDNTGLLLESPSNSNLKNTALLTIDLTRAVADEAIESKYSIIIAYHPTIFRGLKSITLADPQQQSLLRLAAAGISVYSPHTAVDTVPGGMADWLCDIVTGKVEPEDEEQATETSDKTKAQQDTCTSPALEKTNPQGQTLPSEPNSETDVTTSEESDGDVFVDGRSRPSNLRTYSKPSYPSRQKSGQTSPVMSPLQSTPSTTFHPARISHSRTVITPSPSSAINAANKFHRGIINHIKNDTDQEIDEAECPYTSDNTGAGRLITFDEPQPLAALVTRIAHATGTPKGFPVAIPQGAALEDLQIKTVGICPGSGSSVISGLDTTPDLVFTGEMSHHEALGVIERGGCVITLFHSNSERGYLDAVMKEKLGNEVQRVWGEMREEGKGDGFEDESVRIDVSERDRDPYGIVVLQESGVEGQKVG